MAKRRAEDTLLHDSPPKRCYRSLCSVDLRLESMAASEAASPPSLLALLGSRCRKRSCYFDDPEEQQQQQQQMALPLKTTHCNHRNHAGSVSSVHTPGSFQDCRSSTTVPNAKKRPRGDRLAPAESDMNKDDDRVDANGSSEDSAYNSFHFWRVPLPELDLSLLEDESDQCHPKDKSKIKDCSADAMET